MITIANFISAFLSYMTLPILTSPLQVKSLTPVYLVSCMCRKFHQCPYLYLIIISISLIFQAPCSYRICPFAGVSECTECCPERRNFQNVFYIIAHNKYQDRMSINFPLHKMWWQFTLHKEVTIARWGGFIHAPMNNTWVQRISMIWIIRSQFQRRIAKKMKRMEGILFVPGSRAAFS